MYRSYGEDLEESWRVMLRLGLIWNGVKAEDVLREFLDDLEDKGVDLRAVIVIGSRARGKGNLLVT